jgi:hypothetical protein
MTPLKSMNHPAASSGVSPGGIILFAASGGEFDPERLKRYYEAFKKCGTGEWAHVEA